MNLSTIHCFAVAALILVGAVGFADVAAADQTGPRYTVEMESEGVPDCVGVIPDPANSSKVLSLTNECDVALRVSLVQCRGADCSLQPITVPTEKNGHNNEDVDPEALGIDTDRYDDDETIIVRFELSKRVGSSTDSEWVDAGKLTSTVTFQPRRNGNRGCGGCGVSARGGAPSDWGFGALLLGGLVAAGAARRRWFAR